MYIFIKKVAFWSWWLFPGLGLSCWEFHTPENKYQRRKVIKQFRRWWWCPTFPDSLEILIVKQLVLGEPQKIQWSCGLYPGDENIRCKGFSLIFPVCWLSGLGELCETRGSGLLALDWNRGFRLPLLKGQRRVPAPPAQPWSLPVRI